MATKKILAPDKHFRKTTKQGKRVYALFKMMPQPEAEAVCKHCATDCPGHGWPERKGTVGNQSPGCQHQHRAGHDQADKGQRFGKRGEKNDKSGRIRVTGKPGAQLEKHIMHGSFRNFPVRSCPEISWTTPYPEISQVCQQTISCAKRRFSDTFTHFSTTFVNYPG